MSNQRVRRSRLLRVAFDRWVVGRATVLDRLVMEIARVLDGTPRGRYPVPSSFAEPPPHGGRVDP